MQIVYIQESEVAPELIRALREKHGQGFGVIITCMAPPLPVLIEQHHEELVQVLAHLERQPGDEALLEKQRELSSTIDALQRAADRVSGVALDQPADGRTIAMRRAFDIRFGRESRDTKAAPMEYLALWAAAWRAAELETPNPDLWRDAEGLRGYTIDPGAGPWYTADTVRALLATAKGA